MERQRADVAAPASQADDAAAGDPNGAPPPNAKANAKAGPAPASGANGDAAPDAGASANGDAASDVGADTDATPDASADADTDAAHEDEDAPTPADIAAQEQDALWREERTRAWHERTWLRALIVIAVITGLAAVIPYPLRITSECTLIPSERAKVRSELAGVIAEILVDEGRSVKQGEVLARLDDRALKAERVKALAEIERIEAELATVRQAGARPEAIAAHEAGLKRAHAELAYVDERLAMTIVHAPIDGEVLTPRFREHVHEAVEAGGLICEIASTRRMRAEIFVAEREVDAIALAMPAVVKVESYPTQPFEGKVGFIAPTVDAEGKRVRVVVELDNAAGLLKANMTGYGEVEAGKRSLLHLATRRALRWIRVRFLI